MKRRPLPSTMLGFFVGIVALAIPTGQAQAQTGKHNIVVNMADDIGWMNVSSFGGDIMGVQTPTLAARVSG